MTRQLVLDLPLREARGREEFFVSPANALAVASLDGWRDWPSGKQVLTGPEGAGKTHLAHVWAHDSGAVVIAAGALASTDLPALAAAGAVTVEDCDTLGGDAAAETALFHLHNLLAERGGALLLTAAVTPRDWGLALPDLASRVQAAGLVRLEPPDDALLSALLLKQFADRQISVSPALVDWLVPRMHRSGAEVRRIVSALDARGLAEKRPVTRALAQNMRDLLCAGHADAS